MFVLDDLSISATKETDKISDHFFQELGVEKITSKEVTNKIYQTKNNIYINTKFTTRSTNLTGDKPLIVLFNRESGQFKEIVDNLNIPIIEVTNGISKFDSYSFIEYLKDNKITDIIWGGYYADSDILFHQLGLTNIYIKKRYYDEGLMKFNDLPRFFLLDELFFIKNDLLDKRSTKSVLVNHYRKVNLINLRNLNEKNQLNLFSLKLKFKRFYANNIRIILSSMFFLLSMLVITTFLAVRRQRKSK